jgi:hypothetical protein
VLLRLAYLGVTNAFAVLRLLPMSNRDKDVEIRGPVGQRPASAWYRSMVSCLMRPRSDTAIPLPCAQSRMARL